MSRDFGSIEPLAAAVADDASIDWRAVEGDGQRTSHAELVRQFKIIAALGGERNSEAAAGRRSSPRALSAAYATIVGLAALKFAFAAPAIGAMASSSAPALRWPVALTILLFGASGLLLIAGSTGDRRARSLGALFLMIAAAFADPLLANAGGGEIGAIATHLRRLPCDAFLAMAFWHFAHTFPTESRHPVAGRLGEVFFASAAAIGAFLFAADLAREYQVLDARWATAAALLRLFDRNVPTLAYWPLLFAVAAPAVPYLLWKSRFETADQQRRITFFVLAMVTGITPMLLAVILTPLVPALRDQNLRLGIGWILHGALLSVVPTTGYAVLVHRVVDLDLILRRTMQHALARYAVWVAIFGPLVYLAVDIRANRDLTVTQFLSRGWSVGLPICLLLGLGALTFRDRLLQRVDQWFFRGTVDYAEALARVEQGCRSARSVHEIASVLRREIERAVHPTMVSVLVAAEDGTRFVPLDGGTQWLGLRSALVEIVRSVRSTIQLSALDDSPVARLLPKPDRAWLTAEGITLLSPLLGSNDALLGMIVLGESRGGLPYTRQDRVFVDAVSGQAAMLLENRWLRELSGGRETERGPHVRIIDWENEPGRYCPHCWSMWASGILTCACGTGTLPAALPVLVKGKFRVERLLGFGGMGVVYLAVDLALDRKVAIKTLPNMTPDRALRLQREARTMAAVLHPNLALIFGAEHWRGTPLLIVEYLEGGTLADVLAQQPLPVEQVLDLGVVLADALDRVHGSGVLHRDIKPSNIGYTGEGLPKLLDFGLAAILDRSKDVDDAAPLLPDDLSILTGSPGESHPSATITIVDHVVGTPLYLSPEAIANYAPQPSFDLWSLNLVIYEALAGRHPFSDATVAAVLNRIRRTTVPDVRDFRADCPAGVAALLNDALSPVASRRPASAAELRARLRRLRADLDSSRS